MKINANFHAFAAAKFDASQYIASPAYGVNRFMLDRIGDEKARATTIVEYQPNSKFPKHTHIGGEEFLVLKGTFKDQFGEFPALTYVRNPIGSVHAPWVDDDGCTIFVKLLQMADEEDATPLHVNLDTAKSQLGQTMDYGTMAQIYNNRQTGEVVEIAWLNPNAVFPIDEKCSLGEEVFIISGSVQYPSDTYTEWDWFRFPANARDCRSDGITTGDAGAVLYRKTGHLTEKALSMEKIQIREDDDKDKDPNQS